MSASAEIPKYKYLDINNYGFLPRIVYRINYGEWQIPEWDEENSRYIFNVNKGDIIQFKPDFTLSPYISTLSTRYVNSIYVHHYPGDSGFYEHVYSDIHTLTEKDIILILAYNFENSYLDYIIEQEGGEESVFEFDENDEIIVNSYNISESEEPILYPLVKSNILSKYHLVVGETLYYWYYSNSSYSVYTFDRFPKKGDMVLIQNRNNINFYYDFVNDVKYESDIYLNKSLFNFTSDNNCRFSASGNPLSLFYENENDFGKLAQIQSKGMFMRLFANCEGIVSCKNISLSAQLISELCYYEMFLSCHNLKDSIKLKNIRKLAWACYAEMYCDCTSLEEAGGLMATKIAASCYSNMFFGCSSLKEVPLICAETLKPASLKETFCGCSTIKSIPDGFFNKTVPYNGYYRTFENCTGIENIGDLNFNNIEEFGLFETFKNCTGIKSIGNITISGLIDNYVMNEMFYGCSGIESIGNIEIYKKISSNYVLSNIFSNCTSLTNIGYIKLNNLGIGCLKEAFKDCTSLINYVNIILQNNSLSPDCFYGLYSGCINLETAPELLATYPVDGAYNYMFNGCSKINYLKVNLKNYNNTSTTLKWLEFVSEHGDLISNSSCNWEIDSPNGVPEGWNLYYTDGIYLSKSTIVSTNRSGSFTIKINSLEDWRISSSIPSWVHFSKISESAGSTQITINIDANLNNDLYRDCNIIFSTENFSKTLYISQNVKNEYAQEYLTFNILSDGDLVIFRDYMETGWFLSPHISGITISYKLNDEDWSNDIYIDGENGKHTIPVISGDTVKIKVVDFSNFDDIYFFQKASNSSAYYINSIKFNRSTCTFSLSGNLFSFFEKKKLLYSHFFISDYAKYVSQYPSYGNAFRELFSDCEGLISIDNLYIEKDIPLSAGSGAFNGLFKNCFNLNNIPTRFLPYDTLNSNCYYQMFYGCESLKNLPEDLLPAQTLIDNCYYGMFENCYGLENIPENLLPATTLANNCYYRMFYNCENITKAPILPAENLVSSCYYRMFYNCYSLSFINCLATSIGDSSTYEWVRNVSPTGVFEKAANMEDWSIGYNGIPTNWVLGGIVIYTTSYTINALGGIITITGINTHNVTWNLVNNNTWISNNINGGGKGDISIELIIEPNISNSFKEGYIYIASTDLDEDIEIYIYQEKPEIVIDKTLYNINLEGGTINISGYNTYPSNWNLINNESWISDNISSTSSKEINFDLIIAPSEEERSGIVYISCPDASDNIPITINQKKHNYTINLGSGSYPWQIDSSQTGPNGETIYKSSNQGQANAYSTMTIIIEDYSEFKLKVKSDGESSYDYLTISNLDTTSTKWTGSGNQGSWQDVLYSGISAGEHTITITYRKDSSVNSGTDSGYIYIPEQ